LTPAGLTRFDLPETLETGQPNWTSGRVVFDGSPAEADDAVFEDIYGRSLTAEDILSAEEEAAEAALEAEAAATQQAEASRRATSA